MDLGAFVSENKKGWSYMDISNEQLKDMQIEQDDIIHFDNGVMGFEDIKDYVLLEDEEIPFVMNLQSIADEHPSFIVMDPYAVLNNYAPELSLADKDYFDWKSPNELKFLVVTVLTKDLRDTVVNLKSPIVIDSVKKHAKQVILENTEYPIRYFIFHEDDSR